MYLGSVNKRDQIYCKLISLWVVSMSLILLILCVLMLFDVVLCGLMLFDCWLLGFYVVVCGYSSSSSSSSRTDRWVHFQQNACPRLFVHTWIVHSIVDCYQLTRIFGGFSAQCFSKLFLKEFTVLLLTTSLGRAFQVVVILIG